MSLKRSEDDATVISANMIGPRTLLGVLTPSSNTVLEPLTSTILADLPDVTAHFGRLRVCEIGIPILDTVSTGVWNENALQALTRAA